MSEENKGGIPADFEEAVRQESVSAPLDEVISILQKAKGARDAQSALKTITEALGKLSKDDLDLLLEQDEFQNLVHDLSRRASRSAKPGSPILDAGGRQIGKVPYTMKDLEQMFPMVEWTPTRTTHVGYNGVTIYVKAFETVKSPACFRDIFFESERDTALAYQEAAKVLQTTGSADGTSLSVGWSKMSDEELERRYGVER